MKVTDLIQYLYKCPMDADVKVGMRDDYLNANADVKEVVLETQLRNDETTVYLTHD